jgi:hypothetical protein
MENVRSPQDHRSRFRAIVTTSSEIVPDAQQELGIWVGAVALADPPLKHASIARTRKAARSPCRKPPEVINPRYGKKFLYR